MLKWSYTLVFKLREVLAYLISHGLKFICTQSCNLYSKQVYNGIYIVKNKKANNHINTMK